jgi:hypothetical protein
MNDFNRHHQVNAKLPSERSFGFFMAIVFLVIAAYHLCGKQSIGWWPLLVACILLILASFAPTTLRPFNFLWFKFGLLLHKISAPVSLGVVFYLVVFPTSIFLRIFRMDPLRTRFEPNSKSYWIDRTPSTISVESFNNQF